MPCFNVFRIYSQQKPQLCSLLRARGLVPTDTKTVTENGTTYLYELYFTTNPTKRPVKWVNELQKHFSLGTFDVESYSAVLLISFLNSTYAVSFGSSHFIVSKFADLDFGIEIASRLLSTYKTKNSREFGRVRTKSIETYQSADELSFEPGEAVNYIKGAPVDVREWGKNLSCGQSVQMRKRTLSVRTLHNTCHRLEDALSLPIRNRFPKAVSIKDHAKCQALNQQLIADMQAGHYMVSISQQQLSGVAFLFADQYDFVCATGSNTFAVDENLSLAKLRTIVRKYFAGDYQALLAATVEAQEDGKRAFSKPFISFVDYIDTQNNYYLEDGKWHQFDSNYLGNIRSEVDKLTLEFSTEMPTFDENSYSTWLSAQPPGQQQKYYRERYLNELLESKFNYINHDRSFQLFERATVEITDLLKDDTIYIVRIGKPRKLSYAIDQAAASIRVLERQGFHVPVNRRKQTVRKICLWLFLERQKKIARISEINSLIFLMKLANWRKAVLLSGLQAEVRVSYR
ncbi:uncharacterized protein SOCE26_074050 [Sorangium cellulosum]|uniref:Sporadically distributed protein, TIGR04141 family n=1 Tax=Sorangium cellulosum TaxID=56 RepID=A0A2L0F2V4_SORCE|nr:DUF6119 family protein [Sorangium cellulosum]AUX45905.1 uncharacterized protein SOCE26_074050 [Sorangium cellulosum]